MTKLSKQDKIKIKLKGLTPIEYRQLILRKQLKKCPNFRVNIKIMLTI